MGSPAPMAAEPPADPLAALQQALERISVLESAVQTQVERNAVIERSAAAAQGDPRMIESTIPNS